MQTIGVGFINLEWIYNEVAKLTYNLRIFGLIELESRVNKNHIKYTNVNNVSIINNL